MSSTGDGAARLRSVHTLWLHWKLKEKDGVALNPERRNRQWGVFWSIGTASENASPPGTHCESSCWLWLFSVSPPKKTEHAHKKSHQKLAASICKVPQHLTGTSIVISFLHWPFFCFFSRLVMAPCLKSHPTTAANCNPDLESKSHQYLIFIQAPAIRSLNHYPWLIVTTNQWQSNAPSFNIRQFLFFSFKWEQAIEWGELWAGIRIIRKKPSG